MDNEKCNNKIMGNVVTGQHVIEYNKNVTTE